VRGARREASGAGSLLCVLALAVAATSAASTENPVSVSVSASSERIRVGETADLTVTIRIADGWHINAKDPGPAFLIPTSVELDVPPGVRVEEVRYPEPVRRRIALGGGTDLALYEKTVSFASRVHYDTLVETPREVIAVVRYQACTEELCLRPSLVRVPLPLKLSAIDGIALAGVDETFADSAARLIAGGPWVVVPAVLLLGLALNLTPCVYPLGSVTIAYFASQAGRGRARSLLAATLYALGIAITFAETGAAATTRDMSAALTEPRALFAVSAICAVMGVSAFALHRVREAFAAGRLSIGRGPFAPVLLGMSVGMIAVPCVGPILLGLLAVVGTRGDVALAAAALFLVAIGIAVPWLGLAVAADWLAKLPQAGGWLRWLDHVFGCILIAMAVYFLQPALPGPHARLAMPVFLISSIAYLAFFDTAGSPRRAARVLRAALGAAALIVVIGTHLPVAYTQEMLSFEPFTTDAYDRARASGEPFVVEFSAEWCKPCKEMEERTFTDPDVIREARGMTFLEVDMTDPDSYTELILQSFNVRGAPTTVFFGSDGKERTRRIGFLGPADFLRFLGDLRGKREPAAPREPSVVQGA
jgi:thiol:disulfide interchange protein DsbD